MSGFHLSPIYRSALTTVGLLVLVAGAYSLTRRTPVTVAHGTALAIGLLVLYGVLSLPLKGPFDHLVPRPRLDEFTPVLLPNRTPGGETWFLELTLPLLFPFGIDSSNNDRSGAIFVHNGAIAAIFLDSRIFAPSREDPSAGSYSSS